MTKIIDNTFSIAKLVSCVEELQNVVGDTIPESKLYETASKCNYDFETSLNTILNSEPIDKGKESRNVLARQLEPKKEQEKRKLNEF